MGFRTFAGYICNAHFNIGSIELLFYFILVMGQSCQRILLILSKLDRYLCLANTVAANNELHLFPVIIRFMGSYASLRLEKARPHGKVIKYVLSRIP